MVILFFNSIKHSLILPNKNTRQYNWLLAFILISILGSCGVGDSYLPKEDNQTPPLSEETLIDLFTDIHLVEALAGINRQARPKTSKDSLFISKRREGYSYIYQKYDLEKEMIDSVLHFFSKRPKTFDALYEKVEENLDKLEKEAEEIAKAKRDSIQDAVKENPLISEEKTTIPESNSKKEKQESSSTEKADSKSKAIPDLKQHTKLKQKGDASKIPN